MFKILKISVSLFIVASFGFASIALADVSGNEKKGQLPDEITPAMSTDGKIVKEF